MLMLLHAKKTKKTKTKKTGEIKDYLRYATLTSQYVSS